MALFLSEDQVLRLHRQQINRFGGSDGLADESLLRSALAMPEATFGGEFLHRTLFDKGAAYLFHLVQNHPFIDGNKRIGAITTFVFLKVNGFDLVASNEVFEGLVMDVANGRSSKEQVARFLEQHSRPQTGPAGDEQTTQ